MVPTARRTVRKMKWVRRIGLLQGLARRGGVPPADINLADELARRTVRRMKWVRRIGLLRRLAWWWFWG